MSHSSKAADVEGAFRKALKFGPTEVDSNRAGRLTVYQRMRILVRGLMLLALMLVPTGIGAAAYSALTLLGGGLNRFVLAVGLVCSCVLFVLGVRGVSMLMDVLTGGPITRSGKLMIPAGQPRGVGKHCQCVFVDDAYKPRLDLVHLVFSGLQLYLAHATWEVVSTEIPIPCEVAHWLDRAPLSVRRCKMYSSRWARRPLAIEFDALSAA